MSAQMDAYWRMYDHTLATIRTEMPSTFAGLKLILDRFQPPSSGDAFFPDGGDDDLASALHDAGWMIRLQEGTYLYKATHFRTGAKLQYVEGDLYCLHEAVRP